MATSSASARHSASLLDTPSPPSPHHIQHHHHHHHHHQPSAVPSYQEATYGGGGGGCGSGGGGGSVFPSMSVNVSMNMTMGMGMSMGPTMSYGIEAGAGPLQCWNTAHNVASGIHHLPGVAAAAAAAAAASVNPNNTGYTIPPPAQALLSPIQVFRKDLILKQKDQTILNLSNKINRNVDARFHTIRISIRHRSRRHRRPVIVCRAIGGRRRPIRPASTS